MEKITKEVDVMMSLLKLWKQTGEVTENACKYLVVGLRYIRFMSEHGNGKIDAIEGSKLILADVSKLAKLKQFVQQQENIPPEFNDIVNDNFWDLI